MVEVDEEILEKERETLRRKWRINDGEEQSKDYM